MSDDNGATIIPFGKHKGKTVAEVLAIDQQWAVWVSQQGWFREKFPIQYNFFINKGNSEDSETPEHNALQVRFLDNDFCIRFGKIIAGNQRDDVVTKQNKNREYAIKTLRLACAKDTKANRTDEKQIREYQEYAKQLRKKMAYEDKVEVQFELENVDVVLKIWLVDPRVKQSKWWGFRKLIQRKGFYDHWDDRSHEYEPKVVWLHHAAIELKPTIGDDYPAVLRQMRRNHCNCLFIGGEYTGTGATKEQFIKTFESAGLKVVFASQL